MANKIWLVFLLAFVVRMWGVTHAPLGVYVDEAALGYNAYSLLLTGRDEYAHAWPIFLRSFGTYTSALAIYFLTVPISIGGLNIGSIRLAAVVWGTLTTVVVYILARKLLKSPGVATMAVLVMAISPTHVLFSRAFYEPTLALLIFTLGVTAKLSRRPFISALLLSLSAYAYHPLRLAAVLIMFWQFNWSAMIIFGLTQLPLWYLSFFPGPNLRFNALTWLSIVPMKDWVREYLSQYISYFNPRNLFWLGDPDLQRSVPDLSVFYFWQVVPWGVGMAYLVRNFKRNSILWLLLLVSPLAAAFTRDPFSTSRTVTLLLPTSVVIGMGLSRARAWKWLGVALSLILLWRGLAIYLPQLRYKEWNYGYQQLFSFLSKQNLPALVVADKPVYALYLFYQKIDPRYVQSLGSHQIQNYYSDTNWVNYYHDTRVRFDPLVWEKDVYQSQLIAGNGLLISSNQAREHFFTKEFDFSYQNQVLVAAYLTHPDLKINFLRH